jgi:hypothetical protein
VFVHSAGKLLIINRLEQSIVGAAGPGFSGNLAAVSSPFIPPTPSGKGDLCRKRNGGIVLHNFFDCPKKVSYKTTRE